MNLVESSLELLSESLKLGKKRRKFDEGKVEEKKRKMKEGRKKEKKEKWNEEKKHEEESLQQWNYYYYCYFYFFEAKYQFDPWNIH